MEIINITCKEFNDKYGTHLVPDMIFDEADNELDDVLDYNSFYLDIDAEAVIEWAKDMHGEGIMSLDKITCYNISDLGMHVAYYEKY